MSNPENTPKKWKKGETSTIFTNFWVQIVSFRGCKTQVFVHFFEILAGAKVAEFIHEFSRPPSTVLGPHGSSREGNPLTTDLRLAHFETQPVAKHH